MFMIFIPRFVGAHHDSANTTKSVWFSNFGG